MSETQDETPTAVVIVTPTIIDGTVVHWYRTVEAVEYRNSEVLSASRNGVLVGSGTYLHTIPKPWLEAAEQAHEDLKAGRDMSRLATHITQFGRRGDVEPIEHAEAAQ